MRAGRTTFAHMEWRDEGILVAVRRHGETSAIIEVFTAGHGRHAGVVRGASSRRIAPALQVGTQLSVSWRARLDEHIGAFTVEPAKSRAAQVMDDRLALAGLSSAAALVSALLPEREAHGDFYGKTLTLFDMFGMTEAWPLAYLRWEMALLDEVGVGLDLSECAVSGARDALAFVSPRTGRAVTAAAAGVWADKLLPLPPAMLGVPDLAPEGLREGLRTTGHFLEMALAPLQGRRTLPEARRRFAEAYARRA